MTPNRILALSASLTLLACGSGNDEGSGEPGGPKPGGDPVSTLEVPTQGFQMKSIGTTILAGEDVEYCEVAVVPGEEGEDIFFNRVETALSGYSHHLIIYTVEPGSEADANTTVGEILPCQGTHDLGDGIGSIGGAQKPYSNTVYPEGAGRKLIGGQKIIWNYHHLNTSTEDVAARHALNVHTVPSIDHLAKTMAWVNIGINTPPRSRAEFTGQCAVRDDVMVWALSRHTHRWGTDFDVYFAGGERDGEHLWTSTDFELDINYAFEEPILMRKGEGFRFTCAFDNTTDEPLRFGPKATDEMCILFGVYWAPEAGAEVSRQSCVMFKEDENGVAHGIPLPEDRGGFN